jgi:hypothetical protein
VLQIDRRHDWEMIAASGVDVVSCFGQKRMTSIYILFIL